MSHSQLRRELTALLTAWEAPDAEQDVTRRAYLRHLADHPDATARGGPSDHFTGSAFVFSPDLQWVALVFHRKAQLWLQPGGHYEDDDAGVLAAAAREAFEETGLRIDPARARIVDLHHHQLSAAFGRCTSHLDVRIGAVLTEDVDVVCSDETEDAAWWPVDALPDPTDPDLPGRISRARDLLR